MHTLDITPRAERDVDRLSQRVPRQDIEHLRHAIRALAYEPRPHGVRKLKSFDEVYRIKVGNYRVIYKIYDRLQKVVISRVLRRSESTYRA
jgi:mRNA interferase RelE/StbE